MAIFDKNQLDALQAAVTSAEINVREAIEVDDAAQMAASVANKKAGETSSALLAARKAFNTAADAMISYVNSVKNG